MYSADRSRGPMCTGAKLNAFKECLEQNQSCINRRAARPLKYRLVMRRRVSDANSGSGITSLLPAAEDIEWATWAVASGYRIIYEARASVYHSHNDTCRQMARRAIQFEKAADIRLRRKRTFILTVRQAIGSALRGLRDLARFENPKPDWAKLICDVLIQSLWFINDFRQR